MAYEDDYYDFGNNDMTGYDDDTYGYSFTDENTDSGGGGYVQSRLGEGDTEEAWQARMNALNGGGYGGGGSGSSLDLSDDVASAASNYPSGGGGGGGSSSSGGFSVTYRQPLKAMPTLGEYGSVPQYDEQKVRSLQQKNAATGINKLRGAVSEAITRSISSDNPYLRKMLLKDTMSGFGEGIGDVLDSADNEARREYDTEYKGKLTEYQNNINRVNTMFDAAMKDYLQNPYDMSINPMTGQKWAEGQPHVL